MIDAPPLTQVPVLDTVDPHQTEKRVVSWGTVKGQKPWNIRGRGC